MLQQKSYLARQSRPHYFEPKGPNAPQWYHVDAAGQTVGRLATVLARVITGKHKPTFTRHADAGDFIVVTNASQLRFTRGKLEKKMYYRHSGHIGGIKETSAEKMMQDDPCEVLRKAVWGMTSKSKLATHQMKKLKIFEGSEHNHSAQNPGQLPKAATRNTVLS